jgi:hypothetical protein
LKKNPQKLYTDILKGYSFCEKQKFISICKKIFYDYEHLVAWIEFLESSKINRVSKDTYQQFYLFTQTPLYKTDYGFENGLIKISIFNWKILGQY